MAQIRNLRRPARRFASLVLIRSPVYSAIFRPRLKFAVEKHPRPSMAESRIANPGASLSFI